MFVVQTFAFIFENGVDISPLSVQCGRDHSALLFLILRSKDKSPVAAVNGLFLHFLCIWQQENLNICDSWIHSFQIVYLIREIIFSYLIVVVVVWWPLLKLLYFLLTASNVTAEICGYLSHPFSFVLKILYNTISAVKNCICSLLWVHNIHGLHRRLGFLFTELENSFTWNIKIINFTYFISKENIIAY